MEIVADLDTSLMGELPMDSVENIVARFSDENLKKTLSQLESMMKPLDKRREMGDFSAFVEQFPEVMMERPPLHPLQRFTVTAQFLLDQIRQEHRRMQGKQKRTKDVVLTEANTIEFGAGGRKVGVGEMLSWDAAQVTKLMPEGFKSARLVNRLVGLLDGKLELVVRPSWKTASDAVMESVGRAGVIAVDGKRFIGKSSLLTGVSLLARESGWLVVYLNGSQLMGAVNGGNVQRNRFNDLLWDQVSVNRELCQQLLEAEGAKLAQVAIKTKGVPFQASTKALPPIKTVKDLLEFGAKSSEDNATAAMVWFKNELALLTEFKVLVVVDNYSMLWNDSRYYDMDNEKYRPVPLKASQLTLPRMFLHPSSQFYLNGVMLVASTHDSGCSSRAYDELAAPMMKTTIEVEKLTMEEHTLILDAYHDAGIIHTQQFGPELHYTHAFTSGTPGSLFRYINHLP